MTISKKIILTVLVIIVSAVFTTGVFIYFSTKTELLRINHQNQRIQLITVSKFMDMGRKQTQQRINISLKYAHQLFYEKPLQQTARRMKTLAVHQLTGEQHEVDIPIWLWGGRELQYSMDFVDQVQKDIHATSTLFQKIDKGFLRIATNVRKKDGTRAIGSYIDFNSPVAQAIMKGETYYGRAFVVTDWYLTAYEPIWIGDRIEGILYVGIPEKEIQELKDAIKAIDLIGEGKIFFLDTAGYNLMDPLYDDSDSTTRKNVVEQIQNKKEGAFTLLDPVRGKKRDCTFLYYAPFEWYLVAAYDSDQMVADSLYTQKWIFGLSGALVIMITSLLITIAMQRMMRPLQKVTQMMRELSQGTGDLTYRISIQANDEVGQLSEYFNRFMDTLSQILCSIRHDALLLAGSTAELNATMNALATKSSELLNAANHTATAVEEMSTSISHIHENSKQAHQETEEGSREASEGQIASEAMNQAIQRINELAKSSAQAVNELAIRMKRIGDITLVIHDIANRTNLLALNATIQAARAGEYGKGFDIVADEIRQLAEKTKFQTAEIETMISKIKEETHIVFERMEIMQEEVSKSVITVENTSSKFSRIFNKIDNLVQIMAMNTATSKQQAATTADIARQAESVRLTIHEANAGLEQSQKAIDDTAQIAQRLKNLVEAFKLNQETTK